MTVLEIPRATQRVAERTPVRARLRQLLIVVACADVLVLLAAVLLAWDLRTELGRWAMSPVGAVTGTDAAPWIIGIWVGSLAAQRAYSVRHFGTGPEEFKAVASASLLAAGAVGLAAYLTRSELSRGFVVLAFVVGLPLLLAERYAIRKVVHRLRWRGRLQHRVLAVGDTTTVNELTGILHRERYVGYGVVGACVPDGITVGPEDVAVPILGSVDKVSQLCEEIGADTVLIGGSGYASSADLRRIAWDLENSDVDLVVVPSLTDVAGPRISMRPVAGLPLVHVERPQADEAGCASKRIFDIVMSFSALVVLAPLMLAMMALIKLQDRGPVFFRQPRVGRGGEHFDMLKLRSMVVDAEARRAEIEHLNESDGVLFKVKDDPRITRIGRFIRRYSIDEIPQLVNVLRGEMSLVGPRPPLQAEVDTYHEDVRRRLLVRPGMTGLWQVSGRSRLSWQESVRLDLYYVDNWSMTGDLVIMAKTIRAVLGSDGAY